jgi:hypothetical protein
VQHVGNFIEMFRKQAVPTARAVVVLSAGLKEAPLHLASGTRDRQEERAAVTGEVQEAEAF